MENLKEKIKTLGEEINYAIEVADTQPIDVIEILNIMEKINERISILALLNNNMKGANE